MLGESQRLLAPRLGDRLSPDDAEEAARAMAYAMAGVIRYTDDPPRAARLLRQAAGASKPGVVCFGQAQRPMIAPDGRTIRLQGAEGCGLVHPGYLGRKQPGGGRRYFALCPDCSRGTTTRAAREKARVVARYAGFFEYPLYDDQGFPNAHTAWIGNCTKCGKEVISLDVRRRRCDDCRQQHA